MIPLKYAIVASSIFLFIHGMALAQLMPPPFEPPGPDPHGIILGGPTVYLEPIRPDGYGGGINSDATGRPFIWQPQGQPAIPDPTLRVTPNAYGLGVHSDQYGRPVMPVCPWGLSPC